MRFSTSRSSRPPPLEAINQEVSGESYATKRHPFSIYCEKFPLGGYGSAGFRFLGYELTAIVEAKVAPHQANRSR